MHYQRLKTFKHVYENLSFKKAAEILIMTQSAVSQQIAALEEAYDSILFRRKGRHIEPTAEGKALYDWVLPVIAEVEDFPDRFRALKNLEHGKLRIGSTEEASLAIAPFLSRFCATYSMIQVNLSIDVENELKQAALNDVFDFIVVDEVPDLKHDPSFQYQVWGVNAFRLIVPASSFKAKGRLRPHPAEPGRQGGSGDARPRPGAARTPGDFPLERETFLMHSTDLSLRSFVSKFFSLKRSFPGRVIEVGNISAIKKMVQEGAGLSILGELSVEAEIQAGLVGQIDLKELKGLKRKTLVLLPTNREIVYSAWAFKSMFENERQRSRLLSRGQAWLKPPEQT